MKKNENINEQEATEKHSSHKSVTKSVGDAGDEQLEGGSEQQENNLPNIRIGLCNEEFLKAVRAENFDRNQFQCENYEGLYLV